MRLTNEWINEVTNWLTKLRLPGKPITPRQNPKGQYPNAKSVVNELTNQRTNQLPNKGKSMVAPAAKTRRQNPRPISKRPKLVSNKWTNYRKTNSRRKGNQRLPAQLKTPRQSQTAKIQMPKKRKQRTNEWANQIITNKVQAPAAFAAKIAKAKPKAPFPNG